MTESTINRQRLAFWATLYTTAEMAAILSVESGNKLFTSFSQASNESRLDEKQHKRYMCWLYACIYWFELNRCNLTRITVNKFSYFCPTVFTVLLIWWENFDDWSNHAASTACVFPAPPLCQRTVGLYDMAAGCHVRRGIANKDSKRPSREDNA